MRLARNLIVGVAIVLLGVLSLEGYLDVQQAYAIFESDMRADGRLLGHALAAAIAATRAGNAGTLQVSDGDDRVSVRVIGLDPGMPAADPASVATREQVADALERDHVVHVKQDETRLYTYVPVEHSRLALEISEDLAPLRAHGRTIAVRAVIRTGLTALAFIVLVLIVGIVYVGRPLAALAEMARRVGRGDYSQRVHFPRADELQDLAEAMNRMSGDLGEARVRLESETKSKIAAIEQLRHADRLVTVGQLAAGVAHELGTPLNVISGHAKMIVTGEVTGPEAEDSARIALEQTQRMTNIVRQLLDFSRRRPAQRTQVSIADIAATTVHMLTNVAQKKEVTLTLDVRDKSLVGLLDLVQLQQALTNLVMNALQAVPRHGRVEVVLERRPPEAGGGAKISVSDDGPGIPVEDRGRVFEPFFTTKGVGEGTGLGLAVAIGLVKENGGTIEVDESSYGGARLTMLVPLGSE